MPGQAFEPRRAEYVKQTRAALLDAAETLFIDRGYHATSIDAIGAAARFTKGAVYRHFPDKQALFIAVFECVEANAVARLEAETDASDSRERALRTMRTFLQLSAERRFRRIVLEEGPAALGWRRWRELDHHHTAALLERLLADLMRDDAIPSRPVVPLARLCCAMVGEAAMLMSDPTTPEATEQELLSILTAMLSGLTHQPS